MIKIAICEDMKSFADDLENQLQVVGNAVSKIVRLSFVRIVTHISNKRRQTGITFTELIDNEVLKQQNNYYKSRFEDAENQWNALRKMRHDMGNTYILELSYLESERYEELRELYINAIGNLKKQTDFIDTGNIAIDSIINYKMENIKDLHADIKHEIQVHSEINIDNGDLNILLGTLFDNVIDALEKIEENMRSVEFKLFTDKTALLFEIENTFNGIVNRNKKMEIVTTKSDRTNHGIGLGAVQEIVERYHGDLCFDIREKIFGVKVFLYME